MEGFLKKWTNIVTRWKKRYFIIVSGTLIYSSEKNSKEQGRVYLSTTTITLTSKNLIILDTGLATLQLKASTDKETHDWYAALIHCKDSIENLANDVEYSRNRFDSCAEWAECTNYIEKLHSIYQKLEEEYENFPSDVKPIFRNFIECATEFKTTALDSLNLLEEDQKKNGEKDEFLSIDEFEDAKSQMSIFEEVKYRDLQVPYRDKLPVSRNPNQKINIWRVLKDTISQDLSKMAVPVYFNEPLSFLQRFTEDLTYSSILLKAAEAKDPGLRLAYVACFVVSGYANSLHRLLKPFNPLLGETFELEKDGFRVISEQVSHHPPISAIHCDHPEFSFYAYSTVKTSFKGTYLRVKPEGKFHLQLHRPKEHYTWNKPYTNVNSIIVGKVNIDHHGTVQVRNQDTGHSASITFKKKGWFSKDHHQIHGSILDLDNKEKFTISGQWSESIKIQNKLTQEEFIGYEVNRPVPDHELYYHFSEFAMQLNLPPELVPGIAPTDSRRRPDQRALENAELELAAREKHRVEEKQRASRNEREQKGVEWKPVWFEVSSDGDWVYKGGYWQAKQYGEYQRSPNIY